MRRPLYSPIASGSALLEPPLPRRFCCFGESWSCWAELAGSRAVQTCLGCSVCFNSWAVWASPRDHIESQSLGGLCLGAPLSCWTWGLLHPAHSRSPSRAPHISCAGDSGGPPHHQQDKVFSWIFITVVSNPVRFNIVAPVQEKHTSAVLRVGSAVATATGAALSVSRTEFLLQI